MHSTVCDSSGAPTPRHTTWAAGPISPANLIVTRDGLAGSSDVPLNQARNGDSITAAGTVTRHGYIPGRPVFIAIKDGDQSAVLILPAHVGARLSDNLTGKRVQVHGTATDRLGFRMIDVHQARVMPS